MKKRKILQILLALIIIGLIIYLVCCVLNGFKKSEYPEDVSDTYAVYYLVNADGMKGLGHSIVLLTGPDNQENTSCLVYSFNGMEKNLQQSLMGEAGVGCLSIVQLTQDEATAFLKDGNLNAGIDQLNANYDLAVYKEIEYEEYMKIAERAAVYTQLTDEYHRLEEMQDKEGIDVLKSQNEELLYRIYSHNCDTVARELLEMVDQDVCIFDETDHYRTPLANIKAFSRKMDEWSAITIGEQTLKEKMYTFFMIF